MVRCELKPLHPATGRENRMLLPIDNIRYVPKDMPKSDKKPSIRKNLLTDQVFLSARHPAYGSNIS
jgi:hypothetical protein